MFNQFAEGFHSSSRRPKNSSERHSVQIVILKRIELGSDRRLGGIVGVIAPLIGLQQEDVMVSVLEGEEPAVVRIVGHLGRYGALVNSELEGTRFGK